MSKLAIALAATGLLLATAASAVPGTRGVSDWLRVYDASGALFTEVNAYEPGEDPGFIYTLPVFVAVDASQFGNATVLMEPGPLPQRQSDIFGICGGCGGNGQLGLGFASDSEDHGPAFGSFPRTFLETHSVWDATFYLDKGLQDAGWHAYFMSDVPEPASWALMVGGFGLVGYSLRRRRWQHVSA